MKIKPKKVFNITILSLFILFVSLYIAASNGYYEYQNKEKMELTKEKITEFEQDIKLGKRVKIKDYLTYDNKTYDNKITKVGNTLENLIDNCLMKGIEKTFSMFEKMIE